MKIRSIFLLIFLGFFLLQGCCLIGLGIGAISDASKPDSVVVSSNDLPKVKSGHELVVKLKDGKKMHGKFKGYGRFPNYSYKVKYHRFVKSLQKEHRFPALGTILIVKTSDKKLLTGRHLGFDSKTLYLLDRRQQIIPVKLATIGSLTGQKGQNYNLKTIGSLVAKSNFPVFSHEKIAAQPEFSIYTSSAYTALPQNEIEQVAYYPKKNAKFEGFMIGAAIDVVMFVWVTFQSAPVVSFDLGPM